MKLARNMHFGDQAACWGSKAPNALYGFRPRVGLVSWIVPTMNNQQFVLFCGHAGCWTLLRLSRFGPKFSVFRLAGIATLGYPLAYSYFATEVPTRTDYRDTWEII